MFLALIFTLAVTPATAATQSKPSYSCVRIQEIETTLPKKRGRGPDYCADSLYDNSPSCWPQEPRYFKEEHKVGTYKVTLKDERMLVEYEPESLPKDKFRKTEFAFTPMRWEGPYVLEQAPSALTYHLLISPQKEVALTIKKPSSTHSLLVPKTENFELDCKASR